MFGSGKMIGIDISDASIEVVLVDIAGRPRVLSVARAELPEGMVLHGVAADPNALGAFLLRVMKTARPHAIRPGPAIFTLPDRYTFTRILAIPVGVAKLEIAKRVRADAEGFVPMPATEVVLDFFSAAKIADSQDVAYVAVPKAVLENMQLVAAAADLKLVGVDPEVLALGRLAFPPTPKTGLAVVDIGTRVTTIALFDSRGLRRTAVVAVGGDTATNAIIAAEHLSRDEAEAKKRNEGMGDTKKASVLRKVFDPLLNEVARSMAEFEGSLGLPIERVFLSGGTSTVPGLLDSCLAAWKKPVALLDAEMGGLPRSVSNEPFVLFAAAIGAACSARESLLPRLGFTSFLHQKTVKKLPPRPNSAGDTPAPVEKKKFSLKQLVHSKRELYLIAAFCLGLVLLFAYMVWKRPATGPGPAPLAASETFAVPVSGTALVRFGSPPETADEIRGDLAVVEREIQTVIGVGTIGQATGTERFTTATEAVTAVKTRFVTEVMDVWKRGLTASQILVPEPVQVDVTEEPVVADASELAPVEMLGIRVRIYGVVLDESVMVAYLRHVAEQEGVSLPEGVRFGDWQFTVKDADVEKRTATLEISAVAQ